MATLSTAVDLAVRVVGRGLDPKLTLIEDVMTKLVATLSPADTHQDAIRMMQQRNIRRIPLVEDDRIVGIVTLDDLLLDEAGPLEQLAEVIETQIGDGGPAEGRRSPLTRRSEARAKSTYGRFRNQLREAAELETSQQADQALQIVLGSIVRRLPPGESENFISQLPWLLHRPLGELSTGPDKTITDHAIELELMDELGVNESHAWRIMESVAAIIEQTVSPGQMDDLQGQLPKGLRELFTA
ncbi:CBS domain protein [Rubripirellula obstinata]|uniref:CBS domain protein n=1 Tax=Rubripirellula obstinata TaxID=406547 RepID=A0A5B1CRW2_9BACT|nr:DUF2267 domain-containing protein [Rubripirellula obstinata]KAA1261994.1 CBS domain protein [Rubripirellula obstinata]